MPKKKPVTTLSVPHLANRMKYKAPVNVVVWAALTFGCTSGIVQAQSVVLNGDFSNGLSDWTVVAEPNNPPTYLGLGQIQFGGETNASEAFYAQVGNINQVNLEQTVSLSAGIQYNFSADIAAFEGPSAVILGNLDGGTITLSVGGNQVASFSFGEILEGSTLYGTLNGSYLSAQSGDELLVLNFDRGVASDNYTPTDYIGNVSLVPVPEPSSFLLAGFGIFALNVIRCRRMKR
jgi:hypothetical protein